MSSMTPEMMELKERMEREGRFWDQLTKWGFKRRMLTPPITDHELLHGTICHSIVHDSLPDISFYFQLNKRATHVVETSLPPCLFDNPTGFSFAYKAISLNEWLQFVNKVVRIRVDQITEKLYNTAI